MKDAPPSSELDGLALIEAMRLELMPTQAFLLLGLIGASNSTECEIRERLCVAEDWLPGDRFRDHMQLLVKLQIVAESRRMGETVWRLVARAPAQPRASHPICPRAGMSDREVILLLQQQLSDLWQVVERMHRPQQDADQFEFKSPP